MTQLLPLDDVAAQLHVSVRTVRRLIAQGRIRAKHVGRRVFVTDTEVERYVATPDGRVA